MIGIGKIVGKGKRRKPLPLLDEKRSWGYAGVVPQKRAEEGAEIEIGVERKIREKMGEKKR